ncbi:hypothetical protein WS73_08565 [Burkholderia savannae]|nr:hypothetical protein WS91_20510 [Burkholderia sp. MSMB1498]KWZ48520.1 hypothetical protein WS73_08565 [Burkholderia savannae]
MIHRRINAGAAVARKTACVAQRAIACAHTPSGRAAPARHRNGNAHAVPSSRRARHASPPQTIDSGARTRHVFRVRETCEAAAFQNRNVSRRRRRQPAFGRARPGNP